MCNSCNNPAHDPLDDDISDIFGGAPFDPATKYTDADGKADMSILDKTQFRMHEETCKECRNGTFYSWAGRALGPCRKCKGTGKRYFRQSFEQRAKAKEQREARKANAVEDAIAAFKEQHEAEYTWLFRSAPRSNFAASLLEGVKKFGRLTDNQLAAVQRIIAKDAEAAAAKIQREAAAPTLNIQPILAAFDTAMSNGLKRPKMFLEIFKISLAPATGNNAGCLYVINNDTGEYLGKITREAKFVRVRDCTDELEQEVIRVCSNPLENAIAYGKQTGICSCCGRELTNEESIERGIGPICARKFGG